VSKEEGVHLQVIRRGEVNEQRVDQDHQTVESAIKLLIKLGSNIQLISLWNLRIERCWCMLRY
jgi:hypothetical protein